MRIISGKHKGLVLKTFEADNIRPTSDRVREGIFNKIQFNIDNARVLDLFGGTGAISLEFLSRGAQLVVTVDNNINSKKLIEQNFNKAKEKLNLIFDEYYIAIKKISASKFDIIFLDPPFATNYGEKAIDLINKADILCDNGMIIFEHSVDKDYFLPDSLAILDEKRYGTISVSYIGRKNV